MAVTDQKKIKLTKIQKLIGRRMLESKQTKPCFYLRAKADITWITKNRRPLSKELGTRVSTNDFYIKSMAMAVEQFPLMAGDFKGDYIQIADEINIGLAVASPAGLVVPVIKCANEKPITEIAAQSTALADKAKLGKLTLDDLNGACITLTALGMFGTESFLAIPSPGQASILSVGKILNVPVPADDGFAMIKQVEFCLAADHRIVNGDYAAKFLSAVVKMLEDPQSIL
ncbi:MAG: 2-oxo acid dehydrogenase subunit E2 [Anaerohalosphaeraceae bacterium]|nr:2-oxo acid dehydrogenase subunit E2 [Anaerohalosphaeraceae bacterium]